MSAVLMEEKSTSTSLSAEFLAVFAKACYLKVYHSEANKYETAQEALTNWAREYGYEDDISGWTTIKVNNKDESAVGDAWAGFSAVAYKNEQTKEIIIAYRGTDSPLDAIISDAQLAFNLTPQQAAPAVEFFEEIAENADNGGYSITITGHSLGGALAQYVASLKHVPAVTFNAPGVDVPSGGTIENIINYVNMNDPVGSYREHIGETRYYIADGMYADSKINLNSLKLAA